MIIIKFDWHWNKCVHISWKLIYKIPISFTKLPILTRYPCMCYTFCHVEWYIDIWIYICIFLSIYVWSLRLFLLTWIPAWIGKYDQCKLQQNDVSPRKLHRLRSEVLEWISKFPRYFIHNECVSLSTQGLDLIRGSKAEPWWKPGQWQCNRILSRIASEMSLEQ